MRPIRTPETNHVYKLAGGTDANDLPCHIDDEVVASTWDADASDLEALSPDYPRLILDVLWPDPLTCTVRVGDNEIIDDFGQVERIDDTPTGGSLYVRHTHILTAREVAVLADGATVRVTIPLAPPPPISLQFA